MRRKGERKVEKEWPPYAVDSISHMIRSGTGWFQAWAVQASTPLATLSRMTKIEPARVDDIDGGAQITLDELQAFARAWNVDPAIVMSTMPDHTVRGDIAASDD